MREASAPALPSYRAPCFLWQAFRPNADAVLHHVCRMLAHMNKSFTEELYSAAGKVRPPLPPRALAALPPPHLPCQTRRAARRCLGGMLNFLHHTPVLDCFVDMIVPPPPNPFAFTTKRRPYMVRARARLRAACLQERRPHGVACRARPTRGGGSCSRCKSGM